MKKIEFSRDLGFIYDLYFLFTLYFNEHYCLENFVNDNKVLEDREYFREVLSDLGPISKEVLLFFTLREDQRNLMSTSYFEPLKKEIFCGKYNVSQILDSLVQYTDVVRQLTEFYFRSADKLFDDKESKDSLIHADELIKESKYPSEIKSALYSFYINPISVINALLNEFKEKEKWLTRQYQMREKELSALENGLDYNFLLKGLRKGNNESIDIDVFDEVLISFCLYNKNVVAAYYDNNAVVIILGADYVDYINYQITLNRKPRLEQFGNAVSDIMRVKILDYIYAKEEVSLKDIEQGLSLVGTNVYYHLSLMIRAGVIKTRNRGRTVMYSLDEQYFCDLCMILSKYYGKLRSKKGYEKMENTSCD